MPSAIEHKKIINRIHRFRELFLFTIFALMAFQTHSVEPDWIIRYELRGLTKSSVSYEVRIHETGVVSYFGKNKTTVLGNAHRSVPREEVRALLQEIDRLGFFKLKNDYLWKAAGVDGKNIQGEFSGTTEAKKFAGASTPTIGVSDRHWVVEVKHGNMRKSVLHYGLGPAFGDLGEPQFIMRRIVYKIEKITRLAEWTGRGTIGCQFANECTNTIDNISK